jgi:hypothetical protein
MYHYAWLGKIISDNKVKYGLNRNEQQIGKTSEKEL